MCVQPSQVASTAAEPGGWRRQIPADLSGSEEPIHLEPVGIWPSFPDTVTERGQKHLIWNGRP